MTLPEGLSSARGLVRSVAARLGAHLRRTELRLLDASVARANLGPGVAAAITGNGGWGVLCVSAPGAPAAQISGPAARFAVSGNRAGQTSCPSLGF